MRAARVVVEAGDAQSLARFRSVAARTLSGGLASTLSWIPRVSWQARPGFEGEWGPILQPQLAFGMRAASPRAEYFPVAMVAPRATSEVQGFDNGSVAATATALRAAGEAGAPRVTEPLPAGLDARGMQIVAYLPVYRPGPVPATAAGRWAALRGLVGGSLLASRLEPAVAGRATLLDGDLVVAGPDPAPGEPRLSVPVLGRRWTLVARPLAASPAIPLAIAGGGLVLGLLVGLLGVQDARRERYALRLVDQRLAEREEVEARLRRERDRSAALVESIQDGLIVLGPTGRVDRVNDRLCAMAGRPRDDLLGLAPPLPILPEGDPLAAVLGSPDPGPAYEGDAEILRPDGTRVPVMASVSAVRDAAGRVMGRVATLKDITERKRVERELAALASTDHLTGLPNHRTFHERLRGEVSRALRYGRPLALALIDLDHFKRVNDQRGHLAGDRVLTEVAARLAGQARAGEVVARVGGEEFAWILPECEGIEAYAAAEKVRRAVAAAPCGGESVTLSIGVCDLGQSGHATELFRLADAALYWAKAHGRNRTVRYTADAADALAAEAAGHSLARAEAASTIRALARAVDAKDPSTLRHSERVAELAAALATALGWSTERTELLREAALVHDVGKIGVPDAVLLKPGPLDVGERQLLQTHAALGAQMVSGALTDEQTGWVRHHHEREDGTGYPDHMPGGELPEGARILAVADAVDAMTAHRSYRAPVSMEEALVEVRRCAGTQFWPPAVDAIEALAAAGALPPPPAGPRAEVGR
jgi:diguanylate cyclase (GGDEF)-like protein/PAS domain S-box-containing protein/putative nucleotidyltransferase with HDIG domain